MCLPDVRRWRPCSYGGSVERERNKGQKGWQDRTMWKGHLAWFFVGIHTLSPHPLGLELINPLGSTALARMPGEGSRTKVLGDFKSVSVAITTTSKRAASRALQRSLSTDLSLWFNKYCPKSRQYISFTVEAELPRSLKLQCLNTRRAFRFSPCPQHTENLSSGGPATITWTFASGVPTTFSLELLSTVFYNSFAISNNVNPSSGTISLGPPIVPPSDGYTIEVVYFHLYFT